jgi:hypothetical protein
MNFINLGTEDFQEEELQEAPPMVDFSDVAEEVEDYRVATRVEKTLRQKVDAGQDLTDEEMFIAVETISNLYMRGSAKAFSGFGLEAYDANKLTQKEKTQLALEAITNQNAEKAKAIGAKVENLMNDLGNWFSFANGNMERLMSDAKAVLDRVQRADENNFTKEMVSDKRVAKALQRVNKPQFRNHKEVLRALKGLQDSLKVVAAASKYESLDGGEGSKWDLKKLADDMHGKLLSRENGRATYDLNPEQVTATAMTVTIPDSSDSNYIMRNLKANFVVRSDYDMLRITAKSQGFDVKPLSKSECVSLLNDVIQHINSEEALFKEYYKTAKVGLTDILKNVGKTWLLSPLAGYNSSIFRSRIQQLNTNLHYINQEALRGLIAWAASSLDR